VPAGVWVLFLDSSLVLLREGVVVPLLPDTGVSVTLVLMLMTSGVPPEDLVGVPGVACCDARERGGEDEGVVGVDVVVEVEMVVVAVGALGTRNSKLGDRVKGHTSRG